MKLDRKVILYYALDDSSTCKPIDLQTSNKKNKEVSLPSYRTPISRSYNFNCNIIEPVRIVHALTPITVC